MMTQIQQAAYDDVYGWINYTIKLDIEALPRHRFLSEVCYALRASYDVADIKQAVRELIIGGYLVLGNSVQLVDRMGQPFYYQDGKPAMDHSLQLPAELADSLKPKTKTKKSNEIPASKPTV